MENSGRLRSGNDRSIENRIETYKRIINKLEMEDAERNRAMISEIRVLIMRLSLLARWHLN